MAQVSGSPVQKKAYLGWVLEGELKSWVEVGWWVDRILRHFSSQKKGL